VGSDNEKIKARFLEQLASVLKMAIDGTRDFEMISRILQSVIDDPTYCSEEWDNLYPFEPQQFLEKAGIPIIHPDYMWNIFKCGLEHETQQLILRTIQSLAWVIICRVMQKKITLQELTRQGACIVVKPGLSLKEVLELLNVEYDEEDFPHSDLEEKSPVGVSLELHNPFMITPPQQVGHTQNIQTNELVEYSRKIDIQFEPADLLQILTSFTLWKQTVGEHRVFEANFWWGDGNMVQFPARLGKTKELLEVSPVTKPRILSGEEKKKVIMSSVPKIILPTYTLKLPK